MAVPGAEAAAGEGAGDEDARAEEALLRLVGELEQQLQAATGRLEGIRPKWAALEAGGAPNFDLALAEAMRAEGVGWQVEKCAELDHELLVLRASNGAAQRQLQAAERAERQLKKLAKQFRDSETQVQALEQELGSAEAGALTADRAKQSSSVALQCTEVQSDHLQRRVQELEQQLAQADDGGADLSLLQEQNRKQAERLEGLRREEGELRRRLEASAGECEAIVLRRAENERRLQACQGLSRNLVELLRQLQGTVARLRGEHREVKAKCHDELRSIADDFLPLANAVQTVGASRLNLEQRYRELAEERNKLQNLVLELNGSALPGAGRGAEKAAQPRPRA